MSQIVFNLRIRFDILKLNANILKHSVTQLISSPNKWTTVKIRKYNHRISPQMSEEYRGNCETDSQESISTNQTIGTHNGKFHCDEVLACFLLKQLPAYKTAKIVRTRDAQELAKCDIVVDVGGIFDAKRKLFDHHQNSFNETLSSLKPEYGPDYNIRLSSAGLIYAHYGEKIISIILKNHKNVVLNDEKLKCVYATVYKNFVREIDAIDNGVLMSNQEPTYTMHTGISDRIAKFNPSWDEMTANEDEKFEKAMAFAGKEFTSIVIEIGTSWINARQFIVNAIKTAKETYETGEILHLETICPWKEHLNDLEKEYNIEGIPKYVMSGRYSKFHILAVQSNIITTHCRKHFPQSWRGLRNEELSKAAGIPNLVFCHHSGHIAIAKNFKSALELAVKSLNTPN